MNGVNFMDDDLTCCCGCIFVIFIIFAGFSVLGNLGSNDSTVDYSHKSAVPNDYDTDLETDDGDYDTDNDDTSDSKYKNDDLSDSKDNDYSTSSYQATYVGSANSDKFHDPSCSHAKRIKEGNRVTFSSREDALNSGYSPCNVCHP